MADLGHFDRFAPTALSVGYLFGYKTFAGATRNGQDAPKAVATTFPVN